MKKILLLMAILTFVSCAAGSLSYAASDDLLEGMFAKLQRGVLNTLTGWMEFPFKIEEGYTGGLSGDGSQKILGAGAGILKGAYYAVGRTASGFQELLGFWAANPSDNEEAGVHLDGEYVNDSRHPYDYFEDGFTTATVVPMGRKLLRGIGSAALGFMEIPGQIMKGIYEGAPDAGVGKGMWYFVSREYSGCVDIITSPLAGQIEEKGTAFDEEWPWQAFTKRTGASRVEW